MAAPRTFSAFRHANYRLFFFGQAISLIGSWMQMTAQGWLVTLLAGGEKNASGALGLVTTLGSVPMFFGAFYGGVIADRYSKRAIIIWAQVFQGLLALLMALLVYLGGVQIWQVVVFAFLLGVTNVFDIPARQAFVVEMVGKEDLPNAIGLNSSLFNAARILGPAVAGFFIADKARAMAPCFLLNGLSYIAVILGLLLMRGDFSAKASTKESPIKALVETWDYLKTHPAMLAMLGILASFSLFMAGDWILLPSLAKYSFHADATAYSHLMSVRGIGALIGALLVTLFSNAKKKGRLVTISAVLFPCFSIALALSHRIELAFVFAPIASFLMINVFATSNSLIQASVPDALRGKVMGVHAFLMMGLTPLGGAWVGLVARATNASTAIAIGGALALISVGLAVGLCPALRRADDRLNAV
jgi:MFS family permease